jgi:hypothetical protein
MQFFPLLLKLIASNGERYTLLFSGIFPHIVDILLLLFKDVLLAGTVKTNILDNLIGHLHN